MLDSDPTEPSTPADTGAGQSTGASPAPAPRKRAPRKAAAKKTAPAPNDPRPSDPPSTGAGAAETTPPRAPRKRAPRKATPDPATGPDAGVSPARQTDTAPAGDDTTAAPAKKAPAKRATRAAAFSGVATPAESGTDAPPAKAPRKRAAKKASADSTEAAAPTGPASSEPPAPPAMAAPGVLFMAPTPDADDVPKRRRPAKKQATADAASTPDSAPGEPSAAGTAEQAEGAQPAATPRKRAARPRKAVAAEPGTAPEHESTGDAAEAEGEQDGDVVADPDDVREAAIEQASGARRRRRRGRRGRGGGGARAEHDDSDEESAESGDDSASDAGDEDATDDDGEESTGTGSRRRRRRRRSGEGPGEDDPPNTVTHVREPKGNEPKGTKGSKADGDDGVRGVKGSTRLEAKRQRRRDGRETTRRRTPILSESEFLARREAVDRVMAVRQKGDRTQIAVLEDDILVEHYVTRASATSYVGNVYLGRVQNVLPSMEAAFIDIGKGRNGVLYAGEVDWDAAGLGGKSRAIENALKAGDPVLVQVSKDPVGHKGARLTSQISLPGRFLVLVPGGGMTGISRRLPDTERHRLKAILKKIVPEDAGVIVRTAAEGASEEDLTRDVERLAAQWASIQEKATSTRAAQSAPTLVHGEPDLATRVVRDVFNEDFTKLVVDGKDVWETVSDYVGGVAPDLADRVSRHTADTDLFHDLRVDEQLMKALDRKVFLPSGGSLVIDRTEAMTVIDVNTGKFIGSGGNLEQTVTRNNIEAAEEIVRQLRLRDVGGIVVIDFIDMVLESNRELVLRRLTECLGRDRTKHQVAEVTSLGLVQMTRKRVGEGLLEAFSENCEHCHGRGLIVHSEPVDKSSSSGGSDDEEHSSGGGRGRRKRGGRGSDTAPAETVELPAAASTEQRMAAVAAIAAVHRAAEGDKPGSDAPQLDELASGLFAAALDAKDGSHPAAGDGEAAGTQEASAGAGEAGPDSGDAAGHADEGSGPAPEAAVAAPKRRQRRVASRPAGGPPATEPAVVVVPAAEPAAAAEADGQPASGPAPAPETSSAPPQGSDPAGTPVAERGPEQPAEQPATPARPRRRRAASRPAGPPTT